MSDYIPALITGFFTLSAGPLFGIWKMNRDNRQAKENFKAALCTELEVTIDKIKKDRVINNSDDNISLLTGDAIYHISNNYFRIIFENNLSKIGFLDKEQYEMAIMVYNDIPGTIRNYKTNGQGIANNRMAKEWFKDYLKCCQQLLELLKK